MDLRRYREINDRFERTLVFRLGGEAGFFSELNNMLLAMVYCLAYEIRFVLYSGGANFEVCRGWEDFFMPFCEEAADPEHRVLNPRRPPGRMTMAQQLQIYRLKRRHGVDFLTHELWDRFRDRRFVRRRFSFAGGRRLGLRSAARILMPIVWRYNAHTWSRVEAIKRSVSISGEYLGLHIRRGDKSLEEPAVEVSRYVDKAKSVSSVRQIFLLTDDFRVFEEVARDHPDCAFSTLCTPSERGYVHREFLHLEPHAREARLLRLFASVDILAAAQQVVCTFSSNVGMYLGMRMDDDRVWGVDQKRWMIQ